MLPEERDAEEILNPVVLSVGTVEWAQWLQPLSFAPQVPAPMTEVSGPQNLPQTWFPPNFSSPPFPPF